MALRKIKAGCYTYGDTYIVWDSAEKVWTVHVVNGPTYKFKTLKQCRAVIN
jgi:hypothetical protein